MRQLASGQVSEVPGDKKDENLQRPGLQETRISRQTMTEGGVNRSGICDPAEVLPGRHSAIASDTHHGTRDEPLWAAPAGLATRGLQPSEHGHHRLFPNTVPALYRLQRPIRRLASARVGSRGGATSQRVVIENSGQLS